MHFSTSPSVTIADGFFYFSFLKNILFIHLPRLLVRRSEILSNVSAQAEKLSTVENCKDDTGNCHTYV